MLKNSLQIQYTEKRNKKNYKNKKIVQKTQK